MPLKTLPVTPEIGPTDQDHLLSCIDQLARTNAFSGAASGCYHVRNGKNEDDADNDV